MKRKFAALLILKVLLIANLFTSQNINDLGCISWVCLRRGVDTHLDFWFVFLNVLDCLKGPTAIPASFLKFRTCARHMEPN